MTFKFIFVSICCNESFFLSIIQVTCRSFISIGTNEVLT